MNRAFAVYGNADIAEVLDICPDGMVLFLTDEDRYAFVHTDEIDIEWREEGGSDEDRI